MENVLPVIPYNIPMQLDHATIVTPQLETMRDFFCRIAGLAVGERPPFSFGGYWLYQDGKPVIHLIQAYSDRPPARPSSRIDHIAFRLQDEAEWQALVGRLEEANVAYQLADVPASGERQLFVMPVPGVAIEFVTAAC